MLDLETFKGVVKNTNLFAFDLILTNDKNEILLGLRENQPAKGFWFVPGGRIFKNEKLIEGLERILLCEIGLSIQDLSDLHVYGLYDHLYENNYFLDPSFDTHYIICCLKANVKKDKHPKTSIQHSKLTFFSINDLLNNVFVHEFTKNYFKENPLNKFPVI